MSSIDLFSMAVRNLTKRKLRTFLTILGVVIGTAAIVIMISLGIAVNETFMEQLSAMGDITVITVYNPNSNDYYAYRLEESGGRTDRQLVLDDSTISKLAQIPGVQVATPTMEINLKTLAGKYQSWLNIRGLDPEAMEPLGYVAEQGSLLDAETRYGIVLGSSVSSNFYNPSEMRRRFYVWGEGPEIDLMETTLQASYDWSFGEENPNYESQARPYKFNTLGILETKGYQTDYYAFMDIKYVKEIKKAQEQFEQERYGENNWGGTSSGSQRVKKGYDSALVKCSDINSVDSIKTQIEEMGFYADALSDELKSMQETSASLQALLGAIGAVSLFVAAIGIANTMIMAIYERTREIGVMKVIGASIKDIKKLFLLEATLIGFLGGFLGIGLSLLISYIMNTVGFSIFGMMTYMEQSKISVIPTWLCVVALAFSAAIGLISGYFPARRAMKLSALTAIRTE